MKEGVVGHARVPATCTREGVAGMAVLEWPG